MPQEEKKYKNNLNQERAANRPKNNLGKLAGNIAKEAGISSPSSLISSISLLDIFFLVAIMTAFLKDVLDFLPPFPFPVIGTAITFMATSTIAAAILVCGSGSRSIHKSKAEKVAEKVGRKWGTLAAGTLFEMLFGLNFMPVETVTAFVIYIFILQERKEAAEERQRAMAEMAGEYA